MKKGQNHTKESIEKNRKAHLGKKLSKQHKQNISKGGIGKHNHSLKTRKLLSKKISKYYQLKDKEQWKKLNWVYSQLKHDQIFIGLMMSDGSIPNSKEGGNNCFRLIQSEQNQQLVYKTSKLFEDYGINHGILKTLRKKHNSWEYSFYTGKNIIFKKLRSYWYPNGTKIIPFDLKLNAEGIAYWFMGDGSSWWVGKKKNRVLVQLATQGFKKKDVEYLKNILENKFGIPKVKIYPKGNGFNIHISNVNGVTKLMNMINPFILRDFSYKIKYPHLEKEIKS